MSSRSEKVGEHPSEAMEKVGKDGVITIEESRGMETELEVVEACSLTVVTFHNTW